MDHLFDTIGTDLSGYTPEELTAHREAVDAEIQRLFGLEAPSLADVELAQRGQGLLASIEGEITARAANEPSDEAATAMAALRDAAVVASDETDDETDDGGSEEETEDVDDGTTAEVSEAAEEAPVVAAAPKAKTSARSALAGRKPATPPESGRRATPTILAAGNLPDHVAGSKLKMDDVVDIVLSRLRTFPAFSGGNPDLANESGFTSRAAVARIQRDFAEYADMGIDDVEKIDRVGNERNLPGQSLIAAGGWCSPSETLYDLCEGETTDGLIDLPEIGVKRGGIKYTSGPSFSTLYTSTGFTQTEAQNIAGTAKSCYTVPCPSFTDTRLDAIGLCIKAGLLQDSAWPELTRRVVSGSLIAHQHRVSANLITKMVAASTATIAATVGSAASNALNAIALVATTLRGEFRLSQTETLEVVAPHWVLEAMRADLTNRSKDPDLLVLADSLIQSFFTARHVRVQWVYNWQMLVDSEEGYPATFQVMVYPAGTFVRGSADVINLDAVYDAASLNVNDYTGLFFEEGILLAQRCFKSKLVTIAGTYAGRSGASDNTASFVLT